MPGYPASVTFNEANDEYQITFRDFPPMQSITYSTEDIVLEAQDSVKTAIALEIEKHRVIPAPSALQPGEIAVHVPILVTLKAELHNAMLASQTSKADMARKLGLDATQMDRLLDVDYASKVTALEQALYLLGYEVYADLKKIPSA